MTTVQSGQLLVATPALLDPNFVDTVVLLLDADEHGVLGVVLNRPSRIAVADVLEGWAEIVSGRGVLFQGGPVGQDGALAVARLTDGVQEPVGWRSMSAGLGVLDLDTPVELVRGSLERLRIFAGYAGWSEGQLEREIDEGDWYVVPAQPEDAFGDEVEDMWRDVLRRQPGQLAWHSTRPADPELN